MREVCKVVVIVSALIAVPVWLLAHTRGLSGRRLLATRRLRITRPMEREIPTTVRNTREYTRS